MKKLKSELNEEIKEVIINPKEIKNGECFVRRFLDGKKLL
jgi:hypothetical protein